MLMAQDWWPHKDEFPAPKLTISPAAKPNGAGVLVCPGGGYSGLATDHEGAAILSWLNERGYGAWMLEYATASDKRPMPLLSLPLEQAQRALRWVRAHAAEWKVEPGHIGIWGFSAGGHLASTVADALGRRPESWRRNRTLGFASGISNSGLSGHHDGCENPRRFAK